MSQWKYLYNSKRWKDLRLVQLNKEPLCKYCKARGIIKVANVVDHVIPHRGDIELFYGGKLQSLCKACHDGAKQELEKSGILRGGDTVGVPIDSNHHWNR